MNHLNIRPVTDLRNNFAVIEGDLQSGPVVFTKNGYGAAVMLSIESYEQLVDPMESILAETDRLASEDPRRFTGDEVYERIRGKIKGVNHARGRKLHA